MNAQWVFWSVVFVIGVLVAGGTGYFLFQDEVLTAIFFGLPPTVVIGGSLWLTHDLFAEEPQ